MRRLPDDVGAEAVGGGALPPLADLALFKVHSADASALQDDDLLTGKLQAATDWIEGWEGWCGTWFRPVDVAAQYGTIEYDDALAIVGGRLNRSAPYSLTLRRTDSTMEEIPSVIYLRNGRWSFRPETSWPSMTEGDYVTASYRTDPGSVPPMVVEATLKLAASLLADRGASVRKMEGEGTSLMDVKKLLAPFTTRR